MPMIKAESHDVVPDPTFYTLSTLKVFMDLALSSGTEFVRALKQEESELSRIDLAWKGWQSTTLYVPGKRSLLADWVFRQLSPPVKKRAEGVDPPDPDSHLQQPRHWALLDELLSSED
ncbi:hypothetical protein FRB99_005471, partial [Tulasnella sp. 403]